ncbi:unnamed protein product [Rotaria sp. Silwood2]|nr:unnamed protein product [Rotaria sp. Silwood2]CAF2714290.1 unnamed protein product [Rotaria sp. Silwood2]CAF2865246.1 unnamed protein product [Rotaria sp. Silwood2]CAF4111518.1 unnamed protein product [Rotaria sp. Silwood2]CAF4266114.1 unnamed protein product [Rotaria sp. Silwood2]
MPSTNSFIKCKCSSELKLINSYQCSHCLTWFCYQCLIKHHHNDIKSEFMDMIDRIDKILVQFLYHAHSQTAWTNHLTEDQNRLKIYIKYIEANCKDLPIIALPDFQWIQHIQNLINKNSNSIYENCSALLYPLSSFIKP